TAWVTCAGQPQSSGAGGYVKRIAPQHCAARRGHWRSYKFVSMVSSMADTLPRFSIDLFAGAGGLSEGLRQAGFKTLYANEVHPVYAEAFSVNHPEAWVQARDIRLVNPLDVRLRLGLQRGELDLVAGGPPCQGFSINAPIRRTDDERNHLFRDFLRFVE